MRLAVLIAVSCLSSGCATRSRPPAEPPPRPATLACDARLTAQIPVEPPVRGGIVQPATETERASTQAFLEGEAEARAWGREGWARAGIARRACVEKPIG